MEYGQDIPPKTFIDTKPQFFTKQRFAHYMARALQTVGMIPLAINSYDLADPAVAERDPGASTNDHFWFDYPTNGYYTPGGVSNPTPYRPCLGLLHSIYRTWSGSANQWIGGTVGYYCGHNVGFRHFRRRADRLLIGDMRTPRYLYNGGGYTYNYGQQDNSQATTSYCEGEGGAITGFREWKLWSSWSDANMQQLLFVNRIFVHLGKAGLVVQVGTHPTRRAETANILNFMAAFHGGRIPGRARAEVDDVLRDTIDPVAFFDLGSTYTTDFNATSIFANGGNGDLGTVSMGAARTFDNVFYGYPDTVVHMFVRSIDYLDDAVVWNAPSDVYPRPSPAVVNGSGVHVLHRPCILPYRNMGAGTYFGRIHSVKQPNLQSLHKWEDAYYFPGLALGDRVMTPGKKTDPNTGKNWYSIWANPRGQSFALDYDGVVEVAAPTAGASTPVLADTIPIDFTAAGLLTPSYVRNVARDSAWYTSGMNTDAVAITLGSGVSVRVAQREHSNLDATQRWTKADGTNEWLLTSWGWTSWDTTKYFGLILDFSGLIPTTDGKSFYTVEYEYFGRVPNTPSGDLSTNESYFFSYLDTGIGNFGDGSYTGGDRYQTLRFAAGNYSQTKYWDYLPYGSLSTPWPAALGTSYSTNRGVYGGKMLVNNNGKSAMMLDVCNLYSSNSSVYYLTVGIKNIVLKRYTIG